jgi:trehalose-phosphatase
MGRLLLFDYDGTLTPIRHTPERATLAPAVRALLRQLADASDTHVGLVSGRALRVLERLARLRGLIYVGNHGLEIHGPGMRFVHPGAQQAAGRMARIARQLQAELRDLPGALVEPKGLTVSVHWRRVPPAAVGRWRRRVNRVLGPWRRTGAVRVTYGKRVVEVRPPVAWDKGEAVRWLLKRLPADTVVYLGDDRTDEAAFRAVNHAGGCSVFVGRNGRRTAACCRLSGPAAVRRFLADLLEQR